ncbi:MAG: hypothetical protein M0Q42_11335 [Xanthomonadales bacterium]|nr:hypothetical protein [Xanthomonadales bacterium]
MALIGVLRGVSGQLPLGLALRRQRRLQALIAGSRRHQQEMVRAMAANPLRPIQAGDCPSAAGARCGYEKAPATHGRPGLVRPQERPGIRAGLRSRG